MAKLSYNEFCDYCRKSLVQVMGESEYEVCIDSVNKNDELIVDIIRLVKKSGEPGLRPGVKAKMMYDLYCGGKTLGEVMLEIVRDLEEALEMKFDINPLHISDFEQSKDYLILRPISYARNKKLLKDFVYRLEGDVALVLYVVIKNEEPLFSTAKINKTTFGRWLFEEDYIFRLAMENSVRMFKPHLVPLEASFRGEKYIESLPAESKYFMDSLIGYKFMRSALDTYFLSIDKGVNGAIAVFYPGVLKRLSSLLNDDLYVVFLSVREAVIHPVSTRSRSDIKHAAAGSIENPTVSELEFLSSHGYLYSRKDGKLRMLD